MDTSAIHCCAAIEPVAATAVRLRRYSARITGYDGGATDLHFGPMTFGLAYSDHVVLYRFTPRGLYHTDCEITWLVNESAVEGKDYDRAALTWLWDVTTIADKKIIERNQAGVDSRFYEPGPLSQVRRFLGPVSAVVRDDDARTCGVSHDRREQESFQGVVTRSDRGDLGNPVDSRGRMGPDGALSNRVAHAPKACCRR